MVKVKCLKCGNVQDTYAKWFFTCNQCKEKQTIENSLLETKLKEVKKETPKEIPKEIPKEEVRENEDLEIEEEPEEVEKSRRMLTESNLDVLNVTLLLNNTEIVQTQNVKLKLFGGLTMNKEEFYLVNYTSQKVIKSILQRDNLKEKTLTMKEILGDVLNA